MSQARPIWNDGQGLSTPDLQRPCDLVGAADDRVHEVYMTPGAVAKKVLPLSEESATLNPRFLAIPSAVGLSPVGVNGAVRVMPCELVAGSPTSTQQISLSATTYAPLDSAAIASNSSGSIRYDLIYATVNRSVSVTGTRKIKSATDGTLSSQSINLADAPAVTLGVNAGFLTGATAPTLAQINAALPADTAPSSSTFGSFNFPIGYVTVANGYTVGTTLFQNSSGGSTFITQCWSGGALQPSRVRGPRPMTFYAGAANERPGGSLQTQVTGAERWGSGPQQFFGHFKVLSTTGATVAAGTVLDTSIDWRKRVIYGFYSYLNMSGNALPLETAAAAFMLAGQSSASGANSPLYNNGIITPTWSGAGITSPIMFMRYTDGSGTVFATVSLGVRTSDGALILVKGSGPVDAVNGDVLTLILLASDQMNVNG